MKKKKAAEKRHAHEPWQPCFQGCPLWEKLKF